MHSGKECINWLAQTSFCCIMETKIRESINNPSELERLYQGDRKAFGKAFNGIYGSLPSSELLSFWKVRLDYRRPGIFSDAAGRRNIAAMIIACVAAGFLIKIPAIFNLTMSEENFYERNAGLIVFAGLALYSLLTVKQAGRTVLITGTVFLAAAVFINLLPYNPQSQTFDLVCMHLPLLMWCVYGLIWIQYDFRDKGKRMEYIRHNGDLAVWMAVFIIAGIMLTGITIGLFQLIDMNIETFYTNNIAIWGLVSIPVVATFVIRNSSFETNRIAPIVARVFSPLVLLTLVVYLLIIPISGKDPYNDREFLLLFNLMLLGVMALMVFSVSETAMDQEQRFNKILLLLLAIVSFVIDCIALSAIFYRLGEFGISPNRLAVLGSNLLILGNLVLILVDLFRVNFRHAEINLVEKRVSWYLPLYMGWTLLVVIGFPLIFGLA